MKKLIVLQTTVTDINDARTIAKILIEKRLVACAQIEGPVESIYRWKGKIEVDKEYKLSVKTTRECAEKAMSAIQQIHPYEVPEIVGSILELSSADYTGWLVAEVDHG